MMGLDVPLLGEREVLAVMERAVETHGRALILSGNAHFFNLCASHDWLRCFAQERAAGIRVDGAGVVLAQRLAGRRCPPRCTWADFAWPFGRFCATRRLRPLLLGGAPGVADAAAATWRARVPALEFAGVHHGYFDKTPGQRDNQRVLDAIEAARPDVLVVGFGMPAQERWIQENWAGLHVPVIVTAGAAFDYVSGRSRRPPALMRRVGLEWLGRWATEPRRLTRRYLVGVPVFFARAAVYALRSRLGR
jgi:N-acetylglucosaminyldiphosphoundecaprenol N-acetyl-beta-D-mannosaminyltransferase